MTFANEITISDVTSTVSIILVILGGDIWILSMEKECFVKKSRLY
jgi:hypothetical protein